MTTHRIQVELSEFAYKILQRMIEEDFFNSESEALEQALCELELQGKENAANPVFPWTPEEVNAAIAEADADPDGGYTVEQVREHFAIKRKTLDAAA